MINLLPTDAKKQIRAARMNVVLSRIVTVMGLALIIMIVGFGGAFYVTMQAYQTAINNTPAQSASAAAIEQKASDFSNNLKAAKTILQGQISYTTVLVRLTNTLPPNTILTSISLSSQSFGSQVTLSALAGTTNDAINLKTALTKSDLFTNVAFQSLTDNTTPSSRYHQSVTLTGTLTSTPPIIAEEDQSQ